MQGNWPRKLEEQFSLIVDTDLMKKLRKEEAFAQETQRAFSIDFRRRFNEEIKAKHQ